MSLILFQYPVGNHQTSSPYGWRIHPVDKVRKFHNGVDFPVGIGTPVMAAASGRVIQAGPLGDNGIRLEIEHAPGISSIYLHNSRLLVSAGAQVSAGQVVSNSGNTGKTTGPHLHFSIKVNGAYVDPLEALSLGVNSASAPAPPVVTSGGPVVVDSGSAPPETGSVNALSLKSELAALGILAVIVGLLGGGDD